MGGLVWWTNGVRLWLEGNVSVTQRFMYKMARQERCVRVELKLVGC